MSIYSRVLEGEHLQNFTNAIKGLSIRSLFFYCVFHCQLLLVASLALLLLSSTTTVCKLTVICGCGTEREREKDNSLKKSHQQKDDILASGEMVWAMKKDDNRRCRCAVSCCVWEEDFWGEDKLFKVWADHFFFSLSFHILRQHVNPKEIGFLSLWRWSNRWLLGIMVKKVNEKLLM